MPKGISVLTQSKKFLSSFSSPLSSYISYSWQLAPKLALFLFFKCPSPKWLLAFSSYSAFSNVHRSNLVGLLADPDRRGRGCESSYGNVVFTQYSQGQQKRHDCKITSVERGMTVKSYFQKRYWGLLTISHMTSSAQYTFSDWLPHAS